MKSIHTRTKALGACLLVALAAMAFSAASASAAAEWLILNSSGQVKLATELPAAVNAVLDPTKIPDLLVPAINLAIKCGTLTVDNGQISGGGASKGTLLFSNCEVLTAPECEVNEASGGVITAKVKDQLVLHGTEIYDVFSPESGTTFTELEITECAAEVLSDSVAGKAAILIKSGEHKARYLLEEYSNQALLSAGLSYGTHPATICGAIEVFLTGSHANLNWGVEHI